MFRRRDLEREIIYFQCKIKILKSFKDAVADFIVKEEKRFTKIKETKETIDLEYYKYIYDIYTYINEFYIIICSYNSVEILEKELDKLIEKINNMIKRYNV